MVESRTDTRRPGERTSVSLVIPCRPEYVSLGRLLVGALGTRETVDEETIADMKVVVTEACTCFIAAGQAGTTDDCTLRLDLSIESGAWTIVVSNPDGGARISSDLMCDPTGEGGLGLTIIEALVDSMERVESEVDGSVIRLTKILDPSAGPDVDPEG